ncbi:MAG: glycosyltransferase family A protein [Minisyncoccia bacterium]|jgi:glycosyltransferase involved in cell wall biosynthesis
MRTLAIIALRDEERYAPGYFDHLRRFVDGFAVVDDGSLDKTPLIIRQEPKLKFSFRRDVREPDHFFEVDNREILMNAAKDLNAEWVLCCDTDERYETPFLEKINSVQDEADKIGKPVVGFRVLSLRESLKTYYAVEQSRILTKFLMFRVPNEISYADRPRRALHTPWLPAGLRDQHLLWSTEYRVYHFCSLRAEDRRRRYEKFKRIDPDNKWQPIGYDHLIQEDGVRLKEIEPGREFDLHSVPPDLLT